MKKLVVFVLCLFIAQVAFAQVRSEEYILNDVWSDSNNALQATISGVADFDDISADTVTVRNILSIDGSAVISQDIQIHGVISAGGLAIISGDTSIGIGNANTSLGIGITPLDGTRILLPLENDAVTPTLAFGDGGEGFYNGGNDTIHVATGGLLRWQFENGFFGGATTDQPLMARSASTATNPVFVFRDDTNTGMGHSAADIGNLIAGATNVVSWDTVGVTVNTGKLSADAAVYFPNIKSGTTQGLAGAIAGELWVDTDDANTIKLGL